MTGVNHRKKETRWDLFVLPWVGILMLISIPLSIPSGIAKTEEKPQVQEGISVLEQLSSQDPAAVERSLRQQEEISLQNQKEQDLQNTVRGRIDALDQGTIWEHFSNYAILGDSRALAFSEYDFLDSARVLAGIGETIWAVESKLPSLRALAPAYVYLIYGINEVEGGDWGNGERYASAMEERINQIREAAPGARIIVSSILPVTGGAISETPSLGRVPEYNDALKAMCQRTGAIYVDNDALAAQYMDSLWEPDGIHQQYGFYPYWAKNLLLGAIAADFGMNGIEELTAQ